MSLTSYARSTSSSDERTYDDHPTATRRYREALQRPSDRHASFLLVERALGGSARPSPYVDSTPLGSVRIRRAAARPNQQAAHTEISFGWQLFQSIMYSRKERLYTTLGTRLSYPIRLYRCRGERGPWSDEESRLINLKRVRCISTCRFFVISLSHSVRDLRFRHAREPY